jgi:radical SAM superfamily enzyme YgiQ (UPF0313 family)
MINILFVNPVIRQEDKPRHLPYGMAQLIAIARKKKYKIQVFDANAWRPSDAQLQQVFALDKWDVIAIGGLVTSYAYIKKAVQYARRICPEALIVAGGGFLSAIPREIMGFLPEIDVGIIGEAVVAFPELLEMVSGGEHDFSDCLGIIWRDKDEQLRLNPLRPLLEDVDSLPFPAYDLFPMEIYFKNSSLLMSEEAMQAKRRIDVLSSYGCPFKCKYCFHLGLGGEIEIKDSQVSVNFTKKRVVRMHSPQYVIELVKYAKKRFSIDFISFIDENFIFMDALTKGKWTADFFRCWEKENFVPNCIRKEIAHNPNNCKGIHWGATAHAGLVNLALLEKLRSTGCSYLDYGFESFDDDILKTIGKGATAQTNERALRWTIESGIRPIPNQIIGFPDESFSSIKKDVAAWRRLGIRSYPFFATPYPGSEWFYTFKDKIIGQYGGNLENFLLDVGDAKNITAVIAKNFNAVELLGLRELMVDLDIKRIEEYQKICQKN